VLNIAEVRATFQTVKLFFYAHSVGDHNEENIFNVERAMQLSVKRFWRREYK
jgi:hypothetical protein